MNYVILVYIDQMDVPILLVYYKGILQKIFKYYVVRNHLMNGFSNSNNYL